MKKLALLLALSLPAPAAAQIAFTATGSTLPSTSPAFQTSTAPAASLRFKKVMVILFENQNYAVALDQKFLGELAGRGANLANFYALRHPSQPNYIALIAGDTLGVKDDSNVDLDASHLGDLLEAKGLNWKVYAEAYPGGCFTGKRESTYVRKHVPFISFLNVQKDKARCSRIVEAAQLKKDVKAGTLPEFSLYIPDIKNDAHDTGMKYGDRWFEGAFGKRLKDPAFMKDLLVVVTFDEDAGLLDNRILTILYGDMVKPGTISKKRYDHYSLLRMVEDNFGLGTLGRHDATAVPIEDVWK